MDLQMKKKEFFSFINTPKGKMFLNVMESNGNKLNTIQYNTIQYMHILFSKNC